MTEDSFESAIAQRFPAEGMWRQMRNSGQWSKLERTSGPHSPTSEADAAPFSARGRVAAFQQVGDGLGQSAPNVPRPRRRADARTIVRLVPLPRRAEVVVLELLRSAGVVALRG